MKILDQNSESLTTTHWDAIVVGGGMVGAATALGLAQNGFEVLVLEKSPIDLSWRQDMPYETRVSALTRASEKILKNLGAWQGIEQRRLHPFTAMHVWDEVSSAEMHFAAQDMQEENLGHIVENRVIQAALWEQMQSCQNIAVLYNTHLHKLNLESAAARLILEDVGELSTELLIAADGAFSKTRELAAIGLETHDYQQCAVVGCVKTELPHEDTCWQRYTKDGPFAYLAMQDNVSSIAWYLPTEKMQWALDLTDSEFIQQLEQASDLKLGHVLEVAERGAFPLVRRHAENYVKPHFALVGDAAHTIHPQAGQGVNLGLLDASALVETLVKARQAGKSWGRFSVLRKYERWRRGDNALVQRSMEGFDWLFKQDASLKVSLRNKILPVANRMTPIKNWLMGQALNGREALPELAKTYPKESL